jgi:hypothetical protein
MLMEQNGIIYEIYFTLLPLRIEQIGWRNCLKNAMTGLHFPLQNTLMQQN